MQHLSEATGALHKYSVYLALRLWSLHVSPLMGHCAGWRFTWFCGMFAHTYSILQWLSFLLLLLPFAHSFSSLVHSPSSPSPGAGWSTSRGLHDCMLLRSTAWNAGQTWQGGCYAITARHCATFYNTGHALWTDLFVQLIDRGMCTVDHSYS